MNNKERYAKAYTESFIECYPDMPAEKSKHLIEKAISVACEDIYRILIEGAAFKLTSKKLKIKHTKKAIKEFLDAEEIHRDIAANVIGKERLY